MRIIIIIIRIENYYGSWYKYDTLFFKATKMEIFTLYVKAKIKTTKYVFWWRRWESNPRPKITALMHLRV